MSLPNAGTFPTVEGGTGSDILVLTLSAGDDSVLMSNPGGNDVRVARTNATGNVEADDVEEVDVDLGAGADTLRIRTLAGTSVNTIRVDFGRIVTVSGQTTEITDDDGNKQIVPVVTFADDGKADVVTYEGRSGNDTMTLTAGNPVDGAMTEIRITHASSADSYVADVYAVHTKQSEGDTLIVEALAGDDLVDASAVGDADVEAGDVFPNLVNVQLVGGDGNDRLIGTPFNDVLDSGTGSDTVTGGAGLDQFFDASTLVTDVDTLIETQDLDMALFGNYFVTGSIRAGNVAFSSAGLFTEAFLIRVFEGTNKDGIDNDNDGNIDENDEADPNFRTVGDGDQWDTGATVEATKGIFEKASLTGGDHNNTLVVNDSDGTIHLNGAPLAVQPFKGSVLLDNRGNTFDTDVENYVVSILPDNATRVDVVDSGGGSGVDRIIVFGTSQRDQLVLDGTGNGAFRMGIVRAEGTSATTVTYRNVERAEIYTLGGADRVLSNDTGGVTVVDLGSGDDEIVIGTVPLVPDTGNRTLEFPDGVPVADTQNMTNGNSHPLFVLGDGQNDRMEVNHNRAKLYLHGGDGNDRFLLKTFLVLKENPDAPDETTNLANLFGGSGTNRYSYLENGPVFINGGSGTDTIVIVGTPIGDTFIVTDKYVAGAGRIVAFTAVEVVEVDGAGGNDQIYVLATGDQFETVVTGGSGDDTIHVGGDAPTLVFDPPPFTYTPPAFTLTLPPELVFTDHFFDFPAFTLTTTLFDWIALGGITDPQAAGTKLLGRFLDQVRSVLSRTYQHLQVEATDVGTFSFRLRYDFLFAFLFAPAVEVRLSNLRLRYRIGTLEPRSKQVQPQPITVDPLPFAFDAPRSLDVRKILNRLTIRGGDQFESAGDTVVVHNEDGVSLDGRLLMRSMPRLEEFGEVPGPDGTRVPVFREVKDENGDTIVDTYLSLEGIGLGINSTTGEIGKDGSRFFGVEMLGIEHLDIRLAGGNDNFTVVGTPATTKLTIWGGGGSDTFTVNGIGNDAKIVGGAGNDTVNVRTIVDGINNDGDTIVDENGDTVPLIDENDELDALTQVLGRLTVDGANEIAEFIDPVLADEDFVQDFLTAETVILPNGTGTFMGQTYFIPDFAPILQKVNANADSPLQVWTVVLTAAGAVSERLFQERGKIQTGIQKMSGLLPLWYDVDGSETTDRTKTGLPVIVYTSASGSETVYIDERFNEVFGEFGPNLIANGGFDDFVPSGAFGGGWTSANVDSNGGWRSGPTRFILNSNGGSTDPTIAQTLTGLNPGVTYRISVRATSVGTEGNNTANTFGVFVDGVFKTGTSRTAASLGTTVTTTFVASAGSHTISFAGERLGVDQAYAIDTVTVEAQRVPKYVTDWKDTNPLLYIDSAGRRVANNTGRPSLVPVNQVALIDFTRVFDKITPTGGGNDVLNVFSSGAGVGDLAVLMDTYRVPVSELSNGAPVLTQSDDDVEAFMAYHLSPTVKEYFGGEPVLDPFTGAQLSYEGGEPVFDLFTGEQLFDALGRALEQAPNAPMLHIKGDRVVAVRGAIQTWLGGEMVLDELGNEVWNSADVPFLHAPGQAKVETRGGRAYTPGAPQFFIYDGSDITLASAVGADDIVAVTVYDGTDIHNITTFTVSGSTLEITGGVDEGTKIAVTVAKPADHTAGEPQYYDGHEIVAADTPITDAQGNLTFDQDGKVLLWKTSDLTIARRELLSAGTGTIKLQTAPISGLKVFVAGVLTTSFTIDGSELTLTGAFEAGNRVVVEYKGARLHRRGEPIYFRPNPIADPGFWIAATHTGTDDKFLLGNEPMLFNGGEQLYYLTSDPKQVVQAEQRILAKGVGGMPGSIHYFGIDDVNLFLGAGHDKVTIATTHTGTTDVDTAGGDDQVAIRTISGDTSVSTGTGNDAISVGSEAGFFPALISANGTVDDIGALLTVNGGTGIDALRLDDTDDESGDTGTLTLNTIRGLNMPEGVDYTSFESLQIDLGSGGDTFTIESTHAGGEHFTTVEGRGGADRIYVKTISGPTTVRGDGSETIEGITVTSGTGDDIVRVGSLAPATGGTLNQIVGLLKIEGSGGSDLLAVDDTGDSGANIGSLSSGTLAGLGMRLTTFGTRPDLVQVITVRGVLDGRFQLKLGALTSDELDFDATQEEVKAALDKLLGTNTVKVEKAGDTFIVTFFGEAAWSLAPMQAVSAAGFGLIAKPGQAIVLTVDRMSNGRLDYTGFEDLDIGLGQARDVLSISTTHTGTTDIEAGGGNDVITVEANSGDLTIAGQTGDDVFVVNPIRVAGEPPVIGKVFIDGNRGSDSTTVNLFGSGAARVRVIDTAIDGGTNTLTVNGTADADTFLLRRNLIALMNTPGPNDTFGGTERVTYDAGINAGVVVNAGGGNDRVAFDDTSSVVTVNGEDGDDLFQVGQIVGGETVPGTGEIIGGPSFELGQVVDHVGTTYGRLTAGISHSATINGGRGNDSFSVYRNKAVLTLNGDAGDDEFVIRTFLLIDEKTNVSAGEGRDFVRYVTNAPVNIDGGDGFDKVVVIGTEARDVFVVTSDGVWGAGRFVSFVRVEQVDVDGAEGDDTFYIQSTKAGVQTRIFGGLGSDTVHVAADVTHDVVANDLLGHSGLIEHVVMGPVSWAATPVDGVGAEIIDNDEPAFVIKPVGTTTINERGQTTATYTIQMTFQPDTEVVLTFSRPAASPYSQSIRSETVEVSLDNGATWAPSVTLVFNAANWQSVRTILVRAIDDASSEGEAVALLQSLVIGQIGGSVVSASGSKVTVNQSVLGTLDLVGKTLILTDADGISELFTITVVAGGEISFVGTPTITPVTWMVREIGAYNALPLNTVALRLLDSDAAGVVILPGTGATQPTANEGGSNTTYTIQLNRPGIGFITVSLSSVRPGQLTGFASTVNLAPGELSRLVTANALDDAIREGFQFESILHKLLSSDAFAGTVGATSSRLDEVFGSFAGANLAGYIVRLTSGPGAGQWRYIRHNTAGTLFLQTDWDIKPGAGDSFIVQGYAPPASEQPIAGTVSSASASGTTLNLSGPLPGLLVGAVIRIVDGLGAGKDALRVITASTSNSVTIDSPLGFDPANKGYFVVDLPGVSVDRFTVLAGDNEAPGVRIVETDGSTRVSEAGGSDSYFIGLTMAPASGVTVEVVIRPKKTQTLRDQDYIDGLNDEIQVTVDVDAVVLRPRRPCHAQRGRLDNAAIHRRQLEPAGRGHRPRDRRHLHRRLRPPGVPGSRAAHVPAPGPALRLRRQRSAGRPLDRQADHAAGRDAGHRGHAEHAGAVRRRDQAGRHAQRPQRGLDLRRRRRAHVDAAHRPEHGRRPVRSRPLATRRHHLRRPRGAEHLPRPRRRQVHDRLDALRHHADHRWRPVRAVRDRRHLLRAHDRGPHDDRGHGRQRQRPGKQHGRAAGRRDDQPDRRAAERRRRARERPRLARRHRRHVRRPRLADADDADRARHGRPRRHRPPLLDHRAGRLRDHARRRRRRLDRGGRHRARGRGRPPEPALRGRQFVWQPRRLRLRAQRLRPEVRLRLPDPAARRGQRRRLTGADRDRRRRRGARRAPDRRPQLLRPRDARHLHQPGRRRPQHPRHEAGDQRHAQQRQRPRLRLAPGRRRHRRQARLPARPPRRRRRRPHLDFGAGRHTLMVSDEMASTGDGSVTIADAPSGIAIAGLATGTITFGGSGDFRDGISIWSGSGNDVIAISATRRSDGAFREVTSLNTGLGNDQVTVNLTAGQDGFFVLNTQGAYDNRLHLAMNLSLGDLPLPADVVRVFRGGIEIDASRYSVDYATDTIGLFDSYDVGDVITVTAVQYSLKSYIADGGADYDVTGDRVTALVNGLVADGTFDGTEFVFFEAPEAGAYITFHVETDADVETFKVPATTLDSDKDTVNGHSSTLPLVIFGGQDDDALHGGTGGDIVFGDRGNVIYAGGLGVLGEGGPGDVISDGTLLPVTLITSRDTTVGGSDTITTGLGAPDRIIGGVDGDTITTNRGGGFTTADGNADRPRRQRLDRLHIGRRRPVRHRPGLDDGPGHRRQRHDHDRRRRRRRHRGRGRRARRRDRAAGDRRADRRGPSGRRRRRQRGRRQQHRLRRQRAHHRGRVRSEPLRLDRDHARPCRGDRVADRWLRHDHDRCRSRHRHRRHRRRHDRRELR